jgi:hypothetical protein
MPETKTLLKALAEHFNMKMADLKTEYPQLTEKDRAEFVEMFGQIGVAVEARKAA